MKKTLICCATGLLFLMPAGAQETEDSRKKQLLEFLRQRQKTSADQLTKRLESMQGLIEDLRKRGDTGKADLLEKAVSIIATKEIQIGEAGNDQFADLRTAMNQMVQILDTNPDDTDKVQDLAKNVIDVLDRIVATLTNEADISSIQEREAALRDIRAMTERLAQRQAELKRQTQQAVPRTDAEKAAKAAAKELEKLRKEMADLDQKARTQLADLEKAREWAQAINEMVQRQQRIHNETSVRAGKADTITPKINEAIAELDAIAQAAKRAADQEADKASVSELAQQVQQLADRQASLAKEIAARDALERAAKDLREGRPVEKETKEDAMRAASGTKAEQAELKDALRAAGEKPGDKAASERARKAVESVLKKAPTRATLGRDQEVLARQVEQAVMSAPTEAKEATDALNKARKSGAKAAEQLAKGADARQAAQQAAADLKRAAQSLKAQAQKAADAQKAQQAKTDRERAAQRADALAKKLAELADQKETQSAGLKGLVDEAKRAAERAAQELKKAAEAAQNGDTQQARDNARAAQERTENAMREMRAGMEERHDLGRRQGKLSSDLQTMAKGKEADQAKGAKGSLQKAAESAKQAKQSLQKGKFNKAGTQQKEVLDTLNKLKKQADAAVQQAAQKQSGALQKMQDKTAGAAKKAAAINRDLKNAAGKARENDSKRRLDDAAKSTEKAAEALRRSLKRLQQAMPKSAEQDRKEAQDEMKSAERSLKGLRESHGKAGQKSREQMKKIGERQKNLEQEVKLLEERLKRLKEKSGGQRMQEAQSAMRQAQQRLQRGESDEAERAQDRAEKSLKQAQKELEKEERRYRNLRQYELLFKLKEELKGFRRTTQAHRESLVQIDAKVRDAGRVTRHVNKQELRPLARKVKALARDVGDKSGSVEKERAIVYTYILKGCAGDLTEVEAQLSMKEVGLVPQEMLGDVVRRFDMAIKGLERNLQKRQEEEKKKGEDQKDKKKNQSQGNNGKPLLVPPDAEVRMVMVLQKALNQEREDFFENRPDFGSRTPTATEKARLERLYHQQGSLAELFDSLRQALAGQQEKPLFPEDDSEGDGR